MTEPSIHQLLSESFSSTNKEEWLRIASQEVPEKNFLDNLSWKVDKIDFYPYYTKDDVKDLEYLKRFQFTPRPSWENIPKIRVENEKEANARALQFLSLGADGILFDVTDCIDFNINHLLEEINWSYCAISFLSTSSKETLTKIFSYARKKNYDLSALRGSLFLNSTDGLKDSSSEFQLLKNYHTLGIVVPPTSPVQEISQSLEQTTLLMDKLTDMGLKKDLVFRSISLSFSSEENFFSTIAKLKTVRMLWYQLAQAFEIDSYSPGDLHLHVTSQAWISEKFQPHVNMIKNTAHAVAAVLGGCNGLTVCAEDDRNEMMSRVSLHVTNLLKEESHLGNVSDPLAGAYAIDNMVHKFAQAAWHDFQNRMSNQ